MLHGKKKAASDTVLDAVLDKQRICAIPFRFSYSALRHFVPSFVLRFFQQQKKSNNSIPDCKPYSVPFWLEFLINAFKVSGLRMQTILLGIRQRLDVARSRGFPLKMCNPENSINSSLASVESSTDRGFALMTLEQYCSLCFGFYEDVFESTVSLLEHSSSGDSFFKLKFLRSNAQGITWYQI